MANAHFFLTVIAALVFRSSFALVLNNCDDCYTTPIAFRYGHHYMDGTSYGAYAVGSNGHIVLLDSATSDVDGYPFNPQPISAARGSPLLAGFWADADLNCAAAATDNRVIHEETSDLGFLWLMHAVIGDRGFFPNSALIVHYDHVQRFNCPESGETNTFNIVVVTSQSSRTTYVLYIYDEMGWNKGTTLSPALPTVGYGNGQGQGRMQRLGPDPAAFLSHGLLIYWVDQPFTREADVAVNKGNVAREQQKDDGGSVIVQNFKEKKDLKEELNVALQNVKKVHEQQKPAQATGSDTGEVIVQHFQEKKLN